MSQTCSCSLLILAPLHSLFPPEVGWGTWRPVPSCHIQICPYSKHVHILSDPIFFFQVFFFKCFSLLATKGETQQEIYLCLLVCVGVC